MRRRRRVLRGRRSRPGRRRDVGGRPIRKAHGTPVRRSRQKGVLRGRRGKRLRDHRPTGRARQQVRRRRAGSLGRGGGREQEHHSQQRMGPADRPAPPLAALHQRQRRRAQVIPAYKKSQERTSRAECSSVPGCDTQTGGFEQRVPTSRAGRPEDCGRFGRSALADRQHLGRTRGTARRIYAEDASGAADARRWLTGDTCGRLLSASRRIGTLGEACAFLASSGYYRSEIASSPRSMSRTRARR